ncbi:MAG: hypothetical protein M1817_004554 [Caeruleum heppii]|nr:MAG: hypothetical protein M1817_004554 [Caeruleum heppii]
MRFFSLLVLMVGVDRALCAAAVPTAAASLEVRDDPQPSKCVGAERNVVLSALNGAKTLAAAARDYSQPDLWDQFFRGDNSAHSRVHNIFNNIANFNPKKDKTNILCDSHSKGSGCLPKKKADRLLMKGAYAQRFHTGSTHIVLCKGFFQMPSKRQCEAPTRKPRMIDQTGVMLHEMTHVDSIVESASPIGDGDGGTCYNLRSIEVAVKTSGDCQCGPSEGIASAYELYSYACRARSPSCVYGRSKKRNTTPAEDRLLTPRAGPPVTDITELEDEASMAENLRNLASAVTEDHDVLVMAQEEEAAPDQDPTGAGAGAGAAASGIYAATQYASASVSVSTSASTSKASGPPSGLPVAANGVQSAKRADGEVQSAKRADGDEGTKKQRRSWLGWWSRYS